MRFLKTSRCFVSFLIIILAFAGIVPANAQSEYLSNWTFDNGLGTWGTWTGSPSNGSMVLESENNNHYAALRTTSLEKGGFLRKYRALDVTFTPRSAASPIVFSFKIKKMSDQLAGYLFLFDKDDTTYNERLISFSNERVFLYKGNRGSQEACETENAVYWDQGVWHEVEVVFYPAAGVAPAAKSYYFDGQPIRLKRADPDTGSVDKIPLATDREGNQGGIFAQVAIGSYASEDFSGIDDFMIDDVCAYYPDPTTLTSSVPANGSAAADVTDELRFSFSSYINQESLKNAEIVVNGEKTDSVAMTDGGDGKSCRVTLSQGLTPATKYTVAVSGLKDIFGRSIPKQEIAFQTRAKAVSLGKLTVTEDGRDITNASMLGGRITARAEFNNETGESGKAAIVMAYYENGSLTRLAYQSGAYQPADACKAVTVSMDVAEREAQNGKVKLFAFNDEKKLQPAAKPWESRPAYFVSPDGSDSAEGGADEPFQTLSKAVRTARAGDVVVLRDGVYTESKPCVFANGGEEGAPIVIRAENRHGATLIFTEVLKNREKIVIPKSSGGHIEIRGLTITQESRSDDYTTDIFIDCRADHCTFAENKIQKCYEEPIKCAYASDILIEDNELSDSIHEGIDFVAVTDSIVKGNTVTDAGRIGIMVKGGSRNIQVYNNVIRSFTRKLGDYALGLGGSTDPDSAWNPEGTAVNYGHEAYNLYFWNNVVYAQGAGSVTAGAAFAGAKDSWLFNNTIVNCETGIRMYNAPGLANNEGRVNQWGWNPTNVNPVCRNNIIADCKNAVAYTHEPVNPMFANHLYYHITEGLPEGEDAAVIGLDPQFQAAADGNFRIGSGSAAKGAAQAVQSPVSRYGGGTMPLDLTDADGVNRGGSWSIGAYQ